MSRVSAPRVSHVLIKFQERVAGTECRSTQTTQFRRRAHSPAAGSTLCSMEGTVIAVPRLVASRTDLSRNTCYSRHQIQLPGTKGFLNRETPTMHSVRTSFEPSSIQTSWSQL